MSKTFFVFWMTILILLPTSYAFGQASVLDDIDTGILELSTLDTALFGRPGLSRSLDPGVHHEGMASDGNTRPRLRARRVYYGNYHNNENIYLHGDAQYQTLQGQSQDTLNVIEASDIAYNDVEIGNVGSVIGFGISIGGLYPGKLISSSGQELDFNVGGGGGFYLKLRFVRWVSVESMINFMLGTSKSNNSYFRIPLSLGLRIHVFNYGMVDVYGVAAAALGFSKSDGDSSLDMGGQFGGGVSIILSVFEIGLDVRYTINGPLENVSGISGAYLSNHGTQHGVIFSTQIGLAF